MAQPPPLQEKSTATDVFGSVPPLPNNGFDDELLALDLDSLVAARDSHCIDKAKE